MTTNQYAGNVQPTWLKRVRLLEKLEAVVHHKLSLVIAPPGYGKTTLVSQFVKESMYPVVWHSLEENEQDFPNLLQHTLEELSAVVPELSEFAYSPNASERDIAIQLTDFIRVQSAQEFIYVIDDVHHLTQSVSAKAWLRSFIAAMPTTCHVILMGRTLPTLPVSEMLVRREIMVLRQEELSFTLQEVSGLAETLGLSVPNTQIEKIYARMMGWPAGTLLALQPLPSHIEAILFEGKASAEGVFDALAEELIKGLPARLQAFLLRSSTLSRMTPILCQAALGLKNSSEHLDEALNRNLFITSVRGGLAYHSLFRDFLQRYFQSQDHEGFVRYHLNAGQWFESENRLEEAFDHYMAAEQPDRAASIAERSAQIYIGQGKIETLLYWNSQLEGMNVHSPRLHHKCAMLRINRYEYDLADKELDQGAQEYKAEGNQTGLIQITLLKATLDNQRGNFQVAITTAEPFCHDLEIPVNLRGYALAIVGTAELYLCHLDTAVHLLETALPLWRDTGDVFAVGQLLMTLELAYLRLGRFLDMARCLKEVLSIRREYGEMAGIAMALNNLGYQQLLLGEYQQALATLQEGLQSAGRTPNNRTESHLLWTLGDLQRDRGALREAETLYQKALQIVTDKEPFLQASINISLATLKRREDHIDAAYEYVMIAQRICEKHHLHWEKMLSDMVLGAIQLERGELKAALDLLNPIITFWEKYPSPQLIPAVSLGIYAALLASDKAKAHGYLKRVMTHSDQPANRQPFIVELVHIPLLKSFVKQHRDRYSTLIYEMERLEAEQVVNAPSTETDWVPSYPTYSLRVAVLGQESVERDDRKIPSSYWEAASARELFFYLLFGKAASREQLGLILWPDSSALQVRQKFHATLHRVRNAVGTNAILFENDLYSLNPAIDLWCDVNEFKATIKQARLSSPLLAHAEILWRRAVELYKGDFLPDFDSEWVIGCRESLNQMYLDALISLAGCIRMRGDIREAIRYVKRALEIDPYREDIHRVLLNYYKLLGDRSTIIRHMRTLNQLFMTEFGTTPSPETLDLSKTLLQ